MMPFSLKSFIALLIAGLAISVALAGIPNQAWIVVLLSLVGIAIGITTSRRRAKVKSNAQETHTDHRVRTASHTTIETLQAKPESNRTQAATDKQTDAAKQLIVDAEFDYSPRLRAKPGSEEWGKANLRIILDFVEAFSLEYLVAKQVAMNDESLRLGKLWKTPTLDPCRPRDPSDDKLLIGSPSGFPELS